MIHLLNLPFLEGHLEGQVEIQSRCAGYQPQNLQVYKSK